MLALDDAALARLCIAASAIAPEQRERWLRELAEKLDPPVVRSPATIRQRRLRARRKNHQHVYKLVVSDRAIENLIVQLILGGKLSEREALQPRNITRALENLLEEMGRS
jgi:hypothetical protein